MGNSLCWSRLAYPILIYIGHNLTNNTLFTRHMLSSTILLGGIYCILSYNVHYWMYSVLCTLSCTVLCTQSCTVLCKCLLVQVFLLSSIFLLGGLYPEETRPHGSMDLLTVSTSVCQSVGQSVSQSVICIYVVSCVTIYLYPEETPVLSTNIQILSSFEPTKYNFIFTEHLKSIQILTC